MQQEQWLAFLEELEPYFKQVEELIAEAIEKAKLGKRMCLQHQIYQCKTKLHDPIYRRYLSTG